MAAQNNKKFTCSKFQTIDVCNYEVSGDEEYVINEAERHLLDEHTYEEGAVGGGNYTDSPGLRDIIRSSLENAQ